MKEIKVLIFPAGTEIAFEINNALKYSKFVEIYGGSSVSCHAEFVYNNYIGNIPFINDNRFVDKINEIIDNNKIDFIYPAYDDVLLKLTQIQGDLHAKVITSDINTVEICRSKNKTYEFLKDEKYIPKYYFDIDKVEKYPVFVKPSIGQGSSGTKIIYSKNEFKNYIDESIEYTICEYLPGEEYTVDCFTGKQKELMACHVRSRERIRNGISVRSRILPLDKEILKIAISINNHFSFNGAWFFQVKKNNDGLYKLMEISPRIPGTMAVSRNLGINYPLLTIFNMLGYDVEILENDYGVILDRALINRYKINVKYDTVYLDFDDTVYIDNKVNIMLISFIYQCINKNKRIVLLSKHDGKIEDCLQQYKINRDVFDEIIHLKRDEEKSKYIVDKQSIFIDDSFAERKKVKENCNIPVFDLDMIESLLDWKM